MTCLLACLGLAAFLVGCSTPVSSEPKMLRMTIHADGKTQSIKVPSGSSVSAALSTANLIPGTLDRTEPPLTTVLNSDGDIQLVRVQEKFDVRQEIIPFEHQSVRNESLPNGDTRLIQPGVNGQKEITYRRLIEDGKETSVTPVKETIVSDPIPEIVMVGVQLPFAPLSIPGRLAYLTAGNAWVMETTTGIRYPIVTTGDLDGHIFRLSLDGGWLLFSRKGSKSDPKAINSLWAVKTDENPGQPVDIRVNNVVLFADWNPQTPMTIVYSTVEPRSTPPGWQANNDLLTLTFTVGGVIANRKALVGPGSGGIYGWWGTNYSWSPDGKQMAYSRPDQVGLVDLAAGKLLPKLTITPYQSHADWAWVPGLAWSPDASVLFAVDHSISTTGGAPEESTAFHLSAITLKENRLIPFSTLTGMFAYPRTSPMGNDGTYQVAYLQAIFPDRSDTSRYRLELMDQDGSNQQALFPSQGSAGLSAQEIVWSPKQLDSKQFAVAVVSDGNLWLVETDGTAHQVTGDGLVSRVEWK